MSTVHLRVVELEGYWQLIAKPFLSVSPPHEERVVEYSTGHAYGSIYLCINNSRRTNHHTIIGQIQILTFCRYLNSALKIFTIELFQVLRIENVAGTDFALRVLHNGIDGNRVVSHQFVPHGQKIELLDRTAAKIVQIENDIYDSWTKEEIQMVIALNRKYMEDFAERIKDLGKKDETDN